MTNEFNIAIDELYKIFSKYPFKSTIKGCPCCVSNSDKSTLHSKQLKALSNEDISKYAFKAMTTWGDINDFKHYLSRIFELSSTRKLVVDTFIVLGKLKYGNWTAWDKSEKDIILKFLNAWWKYDINNNEYFDTEILVELNKFIQNLPQMLINWNLDINTQGFKNYINLIEYHYHDLKHKNKMFKEFNEAEVKVFTSWIESNVYRLEEGFFEYENKDKAFSERISNTLYMFERIV